jgi:integrase
MSLLKSLMSYLYASGYLRSDPFAGAIITLDAAIDPGRSKRQRKPVLHDEWEAAWSYMQSQPVSAQLQRVKVILLLLKETGCRLQRLASLRRDSLARYGNDWYLQVATDNMLPRKILLSEELHDALLMNFRYRGFPELDSVPSSAPLVTALPKDLGAGEEVKGLSGARIYKVLKDYFAKIADEIGSHNVELACRLRQISADSFLRSE